MVEMITERDNSQWETKNIVVMSQIPQKLLTQRQLKPKKTRKLKIRDNETRLDGEHLKIGTW